MLCIFTQTQLVHLSEMGVFLLKRRVKGIIIRATTHKSLIILFLSKIYIAHKISKLCTKLINKPGLINIYFSIKYMYKHLRYLICKHNLFSIFTLTMADKEIKISYLFLFKS